MRIRRKNSFKDEELLEMASQFLKQDGTYDVPRMRKEDINLYQMLRKRELTPLMRDGAWTIAQMNKTPKEKKDKTPTQKKEKKVKVKPHKEEKVQEEEPDEPKRRPLYISTPVDETHNICGRCGDIFEVTSRTRRHTCKPCQSQIAKHTYNQVDTNKGNVRDAFAHMDIEWYGRTWNTGLDMSDRDEQFLSMVGYAFIFKKRYDK